jgi:hypothetical protein
MSFVKDSSRLRAYEIMRKCRNEVLEEAAKMLDKEAAESAPLHSARRQTWQQAAYMVRSMKDGD